MKEYVEVRNRSNKIEESEPLFGALLLYKNVAESEFFPKRVKNLKRKILLYFFTIFLLGGSLCSAAYVPVETGKPSGLPNDADYKKGLLNVKKFTASNGNKAQGNGTTDDTEELQEALIAGRDYNLVCYFPSGTYLISDTLYGMMINFGSGNGGADREHPTVMVGQKGGAKPVIKGKAGSFNNKKPLVWLWGQGNGVVNEPSTDPNLEQPSSTYNHVFRGIDIDIGSNYNGVGIHFKGAQGCTLEDVRIWSSTNASFYAGMEGGIAIGGGIFNLRVEGGKYGLWGSTGSKFTILAGAEFIDQSIAAIEWNLSDVLVVTGVRIEKDYGPAIKLPTGSSNNLNIVDGIIDIKLGSNQIAIDNPNDRRCSMLNVYVRGAKTLVKEKNNFKWNVADDSKWALIEEYSYAKTNTKNMINGGPLNSNEYRTKSENVAAPDWGAMKLKHVWDYNTFPSVDDPDLVNVKDFGVLGNATANDAAALQAVIDNNPGKTIYLPRGDYRVGSTITLGFNTKLIGAGKEFARIRPTSYWENGSVAIGTPIVKTVNNANANTILSDVYIGCNYKKPRFTFLKWQAGKKSIVRDIVVTLGSKDAFKPVVQKNNIRGVEISGNGGGRWYALPLSHLMGVSGHAKFRVLSVKGTTQPLTIYGLDVEHVESPTEYKAEFNNASNIQVFQFKAEVKTFGDKVVPLAIIGCDNVFVIGCHALLKLPVGKGFIEVTDTENYMLQHVNSTKSVNNVYVVKEDYFGATQNIQEANIGGLIKRGTPTLFDHGTGSPPPPPPPPPTGSVLYTNDFSSSFESDFASNAGPVSDWNISGGKLQRDGGWKRIYLTAGDAANWTDYTVELDYQNVTAPGTTNVGFVKLRYSNGDYYGVFIDKNGNLKLGKKIGGAWDLNLASKSGFTWSAAYALKIEVYGENIKVFVNGSGSADIDFTDVGTSLLTGGIGFETRDNHPTFDNVTVTGDAPTPPPPPPPPPPPSNTAPVLTNISNKTMNESGSLTVNLSATDADGDAITLSATGLPGFCFFSDSGDGTGSIVFSPGYYASGSYSITVTASDGADQDSDSFNLTVNNVNRVPVLTAISNKSMDENTSLTVNLSASDPDNNPITLSATGLDTFASFTDNGNGSGAIVFTPGYYASGTYPITVTASDGADQDSGSFTLTINNVNRVPVLTAISNKSMDENTSLTVNLSASDPDNNPITLSATGLDTFASFTDNGNGSGAIVFTPGYYASGTYPITVTASDGVGQDSGSFTLTINNVNRVPVLTAISNKSMDENASLTVNLSVSDPDNDAITLSATGLPGFSSLTDNGDGSGSIAFMPGSDDSGSYSISVTASDINGGSAGDSFTLVVNHVNAPPVLTNVSNISMDENTSLTVNLSATDADNDAITLSAASLPAFSTLMDNGDGTGTIVFTADYDASGSYSVDVMASDGNGGSASDSFTLTVNNVNRSPVLSSIADLSVDENNTSSASIIGSDLDGDALSCLATGLPAFASLTDNGDGTGSIDCSPGFNDSGVYSTSVILNDGVDSVSQTVVITVNNVNLAPVMNAIPDQSVDEDASLTVNINASDPDTSDTLVLSTSGLPAFGSLTDNGDGNGSIRFDPGAGSAGSYVITVTVDDGNLMANSDSTSFTLTVNPVTPVGFTYHNDFSSGTPSDDFTGSVGDFSIVGGELVTSSSNKWKQIYVNTNAVPQSADDFKIVSRMKSGPGTGWNGPSLRFRDVGSNNWYALQIRKSSGSDIRIYGKSSGEGSILGEWDMDFDPTAWNEYSIVVSGSSVSVYLGNQFVGSANLAHMTGRVGVRKRSFDAWWDYFRVVSNGSADYEQNFDDGTAEGWIYEPEKFVVSDTGGGDFAMKQIAGSWSFATYSEVVSVDNNYSLSMDGRVTGVRTGSYDSPAMLLKYQDTNNWITVYVDQDPSTGVCSLVLKKRMAGVGTTTTLAPAITSVSSVTDWHTIDVQVNAGELNVWVNAVEEVSAHAEPDLLAPVFSQNVQFGVRTHSAGVGVEVDNFRFFDEYNQ